MKLIYAKGACSLSVHILLNELDLTHEAIRVDLEDKRVLDSYNPKSYVPALIMEDGSLMTEAISILQYLSDFSGGVFMPSGSGNRARCTEWLTYLSSELHKGVAPLFHPEGLKRSFRKEVEEKIDMRLRYMDEALSASEYLLPEYTIADMYAVAILRILEHVGIDLSKYHWISEYKERLESRPVIADVIAKEEKAKIETETNPNPRAPIGNLHADGYKNIVS